MSISFIAYNNDLSIGSGTPDFSLGYDRGPCAESIEIIIKLPDRITTDKITLNISTDDAKSIIKTLRRYVRDNEQNANGDIEEFRTFLKQALTIAGGSLGGIGMDVRCEQLSIGMDRCSPTLLAAAKETFVSNAFDPADMRVIIAIALRDAKRANQFLTALDKVMRERNKTTCIPLKFTLLKDETP